MIKIRPLTELEYDGFKKDEKNLDLDTLAETYEEYLKEFHELVEKNKI